jgi:hypothetical protein
MTLATLGQSGPVSQSEYVRLLYQLERDASVKSQLIESLRKRGIDFEVTDGLRGLTVSKSRGDAELRRTLEEAGRRRADPKAAVLPSPDEFNSLITKAREASLGALEEMPDFVVRQQIQRSIAFAGTNNFRSQDRLVVAVSYRASGAEEYKLLSLNGVIQNDPKPKSSYEEAGGTSSTGEFVTVLAKIFKPDSSTEFSPIDTDLLRERRTLVAQFEITKEKAQQVLISGGAGGDMAVAGMRGRIWIDRENHRVLRIETEATGIPEGFPITSARRVIDYDWVAIADGRYLLPSLSDVRLTVREGARLFDTRNLIRFREYQKFGTEIRILDDDVEDVSREVN